jgi:hypothetical protein
MLVRTLFMIVFGDVLSENRRKMVTQTPANA